MKVCDVVMNSVWYDPRVRKQIDEYLNANCDLYIVGLEDERINKEEIKNIAGHVIIIAVEDKYKGKLTSAYKKLKRITIYNRKVRDAIIATGADIIHANDLGALVPAYFAAKKLKCKLIYDSHEIFIENHDIAVSKFKKIYWGFYEKLIIKKVDILVCVSHAAAEYLSKKYKIDKYMVVTNCCKNILGGIDNIKKSEIFEILNHGKYYGGRGYDTMLIAAKITLDPNIKYVLRGFGAMEKELSEYVRSNNLKNVRLDPPVKVYEMIQEAAKSHVGVAITEPTCLNFELSISNKIFEYATAGLPVIMSDIPEHRYLNSKYKFGIILKENTPKSLSDAVLKLYTDKEFYDECRKNATRMSQEINWEDEFGKLINFEKKLVGERNC